MIGMGVVLLMLAGVAEPGIEMSPERVREAIEFGKTGSEKDLGQYPLHTEDSWLANFDTPFLRIAQLALALRKEDKQLTEDEIPADFALPQVHVYVHAKDDRDRAPRNVSYVALIEPGQSGHVDNVVSPLASVSYVRRVPVSEGGLARIAHSVKATFPLRLFVPGNKIRVSFEGDGTETVVLTAEMLTGVR
jgi:hypothetical protein